MGIDFDGGMIIGELGSKIIYPRGKDKYDFLEEHEMESMAPYYDAEIEDCYVGYPINDVSIAEINDEWVEKVKKIGEEFKKITGVDAVLIGSQNIW